MKKYIPYLLAIFMTIFALTGCNKSKDTPVATAEKSKIVVGLDDSFPPMGFRDQKNNIVGFDIDLAKEAAKRLGQNVEFKPIDWSTKEAVLASGRVDVLWNGLTITESRKKQIAFTSPYLENQQIIIVTEKSSIKNKADLAHKIVALQEGSTALDAVNKDVATKKSFKNLKLYPDNISALEDLKIGRIDALVVDEVVGRYYIAKKPNEYRVLEENFGKEEYGVGVRKDNQELLSKLNKVMDDMKNDGAAAKISTKWFGKNIIR